MRTTRWLVLAAAAAVGVTGIAATPAAHADTGLAQPSAATTIGAVSGTIETPSGAALAGIFVEAVSPDGTPYSNSSTATTDRSGHFSIENWTGRTVTWKIAVNRVGDATETRYVGGYWAGNGKQVVSDPAHATSVTLAPGQRLSGVSATLIKGATISGKVRFGNTATSVLVFGANGKRLAMRSDLAASASGRFDVTGLAAGRYYVKVVQSNAVGGAGQQFVTYYGTKNGKKPAKPNVVVASPTTHKKVSVTGKKYVRALSTPTIRGAVARGAKLTATKGRFAPAAGLKIRYQWTFNGKNVPGATAKTYRIPRSAAAGDVIGVRIKASKSGYRTAIAWWGVVLQS